MTGTTAYYVHLLQGDDIDADYARLDQIGGPQTTPHYPRGWAMASGTPFRLYKINTHQGGHSVPFCLSWPAGLAGAGIDPEPVRARHRPAPDAARAHRRRASRRAPGRRARAARGRELRGRAHGRRRAQQPPPAGVRVQRAPRPVPRRLGARDPAPAAHAVHRRGVGAVRPDRGPDRAAQPRGRGARTGRGDGGGVGGARLGALRVPARRGQQHQVPATAGAQRGVRRAGHHPARHPDARAVALGPAALVPVGEHPGAARPPRRGPGDARRARRPGRGIRAVRARRRAVLRAQQRAGPDARRSPAAR